MRFGVHIPTCIEGMMYPVPFAKPSDILPTALLCERLGFDSVWGNDHMTTQRYVQKEFPDPPNFFEPLMTFAYCASRTTRLRFATGIIVLPMRNMPVLAKQVATLDQLSGGRVTLGVGTGAYREEYEALFPDARGARRGTIVDEGMQALRLLFTERKATFRGQAVHFEEVECFPKPLQSPMPIYAGGNHPEVRRRAGQWAQGWMPAVLSPEEITRGSTTFTAPPSRPGGTAPPSTSRPSSRCRSGAPTTRRSRASGARSSSSTWSRSRSRLSGSRPVASTSAT
jgi:probable F420-dependent oxidoreductase